jgi:hypothetical protein
MCRDAGDSKAHDKYYEATSHKLAIHTFFVACLARMFYGM